MALTVNNICGFETGGLEEASGITSTPDATEAIVVRSGIRSLKLGTSDGYHLPWVDGGVTDAGSGYVFGFAFRTDGSSNLDLVRILDDAIATICEVTISGVGNLELNNAQGSRLDSTTGTDYSDDAWHYVEVYAELNNASGAWEWFIDGVSEGSDTGADLTDGNAFGSASSSLRLRPASDANPFYFDDVYILSGATASSDRLGGSSLSEMPEIFMYQNTVEDATDQGDALADGTWALVGETPLNEGTSNDAQYQDTGNLTGSTICDEGSRAGPSGDANIDGDSNIKAAKFIGRFMRGTGGGRTHSFLHGNSGDGVTASADMGLNVGFETRTIISEAASIVPLSTESFQHGFSKSATAGQDIFCGEIWAMLLHVPDAGGPNTETITATATGVPIIRLHVSKTLAATAAANPTITRKTFKTLAATAIGIAALTVRKLDTLINLAATAVGVTALQLKAKLGLGGTAAGVPTLNLKAKKILAATATGIAALFTNFSFIVVLAATATGVANLTKKAKIGLGAVAIGIPDVVVNAVVAAAKVTVAAVAAGVTTLRLKVKIGLAATATGTPALGKFIRKTIAAVATGVGRIVKKVFLTLPTSTGGFLMFASEFDGSNDFLRRTSNLTDIADSKVGVISFWLNRTGGSGNQQILQGHDDTLGIFLPSVRLVTSNVLSLDLADSGGTTILQLDSNRTILATDDWVHCLVSWDLNVATAREQLFVNDVDESNVVDGPTDADVDYTAADVWSVGAERFDGDLLTGCLAQVYFDPTADLDLAITANRRLFINADLTPADLGFDGSNPTGNAPIVYFHKKAVNFHENSGTGGDFVQNGTLTECPPPHGVIATLTKLRTAFVTITATAQGVVSLTKKAKLKLGSTAVGVADVVANAIVATVFVAIDAIATGVVSIQLKVKKILAGTATGVPALAPRSIFRIALAAAASGIVSLKKKAKLGLSGTAIDIVTLTKKAKLNLSVTVIGEPNIVLKAKLILQATATGVAALVVDFIGLTNVAIAATAIAIAALQLKVKKILKASATGIPTLSFSSTFRIALAVTATGVVNLTKKAKLGLSGIVIGTARLVRKTKLNLSATATGAVDIVKKAKLIVRVTATGITGLIVNAIAGATLVTITAVATAIATLNLTVKKRLEAVSLGIPTLTPLKAFKRLLAAVGAGVAALKVRVIFRKRVSATAVGVANITKKAKLNLNATATGVASVIRKTLKILKATGEGVATLAVIAATLIAVAVVALGIPTLRLKVKKGLAASGAGVAKIRKSVSLTLRAFAVGIVTVNELGPTIAEKLKTRIIGFFGGPGGGPGR